MRFLGFKVQGGITSEANVFATLLRERGNQFDARVVYHSWGQGDGLAHFRERSKADVFAVDLGQRPASMQHSAAAKLRGIVKYRREFPRIIANSRQYAPHVVYSSQQLWDSALAGSVARALGVPHIVHLHFNIGPWLSTGFSPTPRLLSGVRKVLGIADPLRTIRTCGHVVTVSDFLRRQVIEFGVPEDRVTTIHNAMRVSSVAPGTRERIRAELGFDSGAILIAHVGALLASKGQLETIEAFANLAPTFPQACMVVVGDGAERGQIEALIARHRLSDRIKLTGQRSDVPEILASADIFAHPSKRDPFPLAVLEGLAAGLPVVGWADGGVCEQVVHGETGLLVKTGSVAELSNALRTLLADPEARRRMGEAARTYAEANFLPSHACHAFAELLRRVTGQK